MEEKRYLDEDLDFALRLLNEPKAKQTEEAVQWLADPEHEMLYKSLLATRQATIAHAKAGDVDVKLAWREFNERHQVVAPKIHRHSFWWGAVAASFALFIVFSFLYIYEGSSTPENVVVYTATPGDSDVILQTGNGQVLNLSSTVAAEALQKVSAVAVEKDGIDYVADAAVKEVAVEMHTLHTPQGKNFKITLEDGTQVWLNAKSSLHYPTHFAGSERLVELEGEAYFQVAHNEKLPFIVKTKNAVTQVLGTEFNFKAYDYGDTHVTLINGSVRVTEQQNQQEVMLHPGEDVQIDHSTKMTVREVDTRSFTAWKEGYFYFKDKELGEIMTSVGRWYNLTVEFRNSDHTHLRFNFWARQADGVNETLQLLNDIGKVKATLKDNTIIIE